MKVRILPGQPGSLALREKVPHPRRKAAIGGSLGNKLRLQAPIWGIRSANLATVSGSRLKNSRFRETEAGDRDRSALRGKYFSAYPTQQSVAPCARPPSLFTKIQIALAALAGCAI